jgi:hypothetical protein
MGFPWVMSESRRPRPRARYINLKKRTDFNGKFIAAAAEATVAVGAGEVLMKNDKGVVIHLFPKTQGVNLKLAGEGVKFTLEKKKK